VLIRLQVRQFICPVLDCARRNVVEQLAGLTIRHGRRSLQLLGLLAAIAFALAGRAGARLARGAAITVSRGPVEAHVNRLKMLKRQMFGRANLDLLRCRVLVTT
jgi:hypothetical protein